MLAPCCRNQPQAWIGGQRTGELAMIKEAYGHGAPNASRNAATSSASMHP